MRLRIFIWTTMALAIAGLLWLARGLTPYVEIWGTVLAGFGWSRPAVRLGEAGLVLVCYAGLATCLFAIPYVGMLAWIGGRQDQRRAP